MNYNIKNISSAKFSINSRTLFKTFIAIPVGSTHVKIVSVYDSKCVLMQKQPLDNLQIDGVTFNDAISFVNAVHDIIFSISATGALSDAQVEQNRQDISALQDANIDPNHDHDNIYYRKNYIDTLITTFVGSNALIKSANIDGDFIFFNNEDLDTLFSLDVSALNNQGVSVSFLNGKLTLKNAKGDTLSTTEISAKESYFDVFRYIEDVPDSLAITSISFNYGVLKTISNKYYFVSKKDNTVQFKNNRIYINDLEQFIDFNEPDLETSDFLAWEVNLNDNSFLDNEFYRFNFWSIKQEASSIIVFGNPFSLLKHPANNNPLLSNTIQNNDIICDGYRDNNTLWTKAVCLDENNINSSASWNLIDSIVF